MSYDHITKSKLEVLAPNMMRLTPGGLYDLKENNPTEMAVVKLHVLQKHIEMAIESWAHSGENTIRMGKEMDELASRLFERYEPYIEEGADPFKFHDYELERTHLGDAYIVTQIEQLSERSRRDLFHILRLFDLSRTTAGYYLYVYLHDRKTLSQELYRALQDFPDVLELDYDADVECMYVKMMA